jgi:transcriptional regulator with XRE-family HTH domain
MLDAVIVGRVIQNYREKRNLSQEVVSGLADIGRTHLSAIERGVRKPTLDTFFKLAEALDIEPNKLLKLIEDEIKKANKL